MDRYEIALRGEIGAYRERLSALRGEVASLTARWEALEHALDIYEKTKPSSIERRDPPGRAGTKTAFVLGAIRESGAQGLTAGEIYEELAKARLSMQKATVRSLLYGRKKDGILERLPDGRYRFLQSQDKSTDAEKAGGEHDEA